MDAFLKYFHDVSTFLVFLFKLLFSDWNSGLGSPMEARTGSKRVDYLEQS
jgi:hypothetical protein